MADTNLQEVHDFLIEVAKKAGYMITTLRPQQEIGNKKNSVDLVTEVDQAVEKMVTETCQEAYPHFNFMGEETYQPGDKLTDAPTFIVDPIDGKIEHLDKGGAATNIIRTATNPSYRNQVPQTLFIYIPTYAYHWEWQSTGSL